MKGWGINLLLLAVLALPALGSPATEKGPKYDKSTEVKVSGVVTDVKDYDCPISGTLGAHVTIQPAQGPAIEVHVAATKYVKSYEMVFAKGDKIDVLGSKVQFNGTDAIIAREITRGQDTFTFRDANGKALW